MPSEHRLHPASILFEFGGLLRRFALPGLLVLFTAGRRSPGPSGDFQFVPQNWDVWMMLLIVPNMLVSLARYWSFRLRYEGSELVIRSGVLFRNVRHVPYARIQNLDAVQNVVHRLLGVVEVRLETGGGSEPEATMSVLSVDAFARMRARVFAGRPTAADAGAPPSGPAALADPARGRTLLRLPGRELLLRGFIENRGMLLIGAAYGLLWNAGAFEGFWQRGIGSGPSLRRFVRDGVAGLFGDGAHWLGPIALATAGLLAVLLFVRVISMAWALVRLHDFTLTRAGNDLRAEYGLLTRVTATVPLRRVQTLTIEEGPWHRLASRVSVRAETAGGTGGEPGARQREWLAPLLPLERLPAFVEEVLPGVDMDGLAWEAVHPRAFRRATTPRLALAVIVSLAAAVPLGTRALLVLLIAAAWALVAAHRYVAHLAWAETKDFVAFRSGWITRRTTIAPVAKAQVIGVTESPFDRRTAMARLHLDTAGAGLDAHRVDIPYLARDVAHALGDRLAAQANRAAFRW